MGLLILLLLTEWKGNKLQLKKIEVKTLAITSILNVAKLEIKIKKWWESKLVLDLKKSEPGKVIKKVIEGRLNRLMKNYLSTECKIELEEPLILIFIR